MLYAQVLLDLDRAFKSNPAFQCELEKLLAIQPINPIPYEPNGSDGLVLTIIMELAKIAKEIA